MVCGPYLYSSVWSRLEGWERTMVNGFIQRWTINRGDRAIQRGGTDQRSFSSYWSQDGTKPRRSFLFDSKPLIPRSFLEGCERENRKGIKSQPSFAAKTIPAVDFVDVSKLPYPCLEGERPHIKIAQDAYLRVRGLYYSKHSLIGHLHLSKIPILRVRKMAKQLWKPS